MEEDSIEEKISCVKYFDALWFCYSPVHQLKRYYVHGDVDDCLGHWGKLVACLKQKTKFGDEESREELIMPCLWEIRSAEEATTFWETEFANSDSPERP